MRWDQLGSEWRGTRLRVKVANRVYEMTQGQFRGLLAVASEQVPFGIYAAEKSGYAELLNQGCKSKRQLKESRRQWKSQGFQVYVNG